MARDLRRALAELVPFSGTSPLSHREAGISTIEVVLLAPLIVFLMLLMAAFGILVDANGEVSTAATDAARAGSLQRSYDTASTAAQQAAQADLAGTCDDVQVTYPGEGPGTFTPGSLFTVVVTCQAKTFGVLGVNVPKKFTQQAASPLDPYRRTTTN
jgi:Flp pilus assembly protein TadG